jgi:hypothetical protein
MGAFGMAVTSAATAMGIEPPPLSTRMLVGMNFEAFRRSIPKIIRTQVDIEILNFFVEKPGGSIGQHADRDDGLCYRRNIGGNGH